MSFYSLLPLVSVSLRLGATTEKSGKDGAMMKGAVLDSL